MRRRPGEILTFGTRPERTGPESAAEFVLPCSRLDVGIHPVRRSTCSGGSGRASEDLGCQAREPLISAGFLGGAIPSARARRDHPERTKPIGTGATSYGKNSGAFANDRP